MKLTGEKIYLRLLEESDAEAMLKLHVKNREFFKDYSPKKDDDFYTLDNHLTAIKTSIEKTKQGLRYSFGIFLIENDMLIGNITLAEILRWAMQSCFVGYYLDKEHNGKGYMSEAIKLIVEYGFKELKLHRIEAGVMPHNIGSIRVLEKAGFVKEGIARKNVEINGKWEDHQVLAIINEDYDR